MPKSTRQVRNRKKRPLGARDLYSLRIATSISISPDENLIAASVERMDEKDQKYYANLHIWNLADNTERQFTFGKHNDGRAVFSPDGSMIAFVSSRDKKTGIYLMPTEGGAERQVLEIEGTVTNLQWTPDMKSLVFCLRYHDSHFEKDEKKKIEPPLHRHITRFFWRLDGAGALPRDTFQVYRLAIDDGALEQITKSKRDCTQVALSPDGKLVAYISNRAKDPDLDDGYDELFIKPLAKGKEKSLPAPDGPKTSPVFSPDGRNIAYLGHDNAHDAWGTTPVHVWKVNVSGKSRAKNLTADFDRQCHDESITDTGEQTAYLPLVWSADSRRLFFLSSDTGVTNLFYVPAKGGKPTRIFRGDCHIRGFAVNGKTRTAALIHADLSNPSEIRSCSATYGGEKKAKTHSKLNRFLSDEVALGRTREIRFKSFDDTEVQGWVVYPPDFRSTKRYPAILEVHGGPRVQYAFSFMHEMQYLAAQGYIVFYTNPRGGAGRGRTWSEAIVASWGDLDYKDVMAAADWMEKQKHIDPKRIGITGGSYGGYMTNWVISHTNRFRAAVTQRSVVDLRSFQGSSDIGYALRREFGGWSWEVPEIYERCSPVTYFKDVKTPVLIIHSEQDLRCHHEQAEQMFVMLKALGKKVEMVRFPQEPHGLSRHGRPDRRIARLEWIDKWFKRYLKR
jgi:dipeptidyl aminopeptidase/acylaminoacyl peptidase